MLMNECIEALGSEADVTEDLHMYVIHTVEMFNGNVYSFTMLIAASRRLAIVRQTHCRSVLHICNRFAT